MYINVKLKNIFTVSIKYTVPDKINKLKNVYFSILIVNFLGFTFKYT